MKTNEENGVTPEQVQGRLQCKRGIALDQNPYPKKSTDAWNWRIGWLQAKNDQYIQEQQARMLK